jgi:predicted class III extradiol MEMO1 family dioxygenase
LEHGGRSYNYWNMVGEVVIIGTRWEKFLSEIHLKSRQEMSNALGEIRIEHEICKETIIESFVFFW